MSLVRLTAKASVTLPTVRAAPPKRAPPLSAVVALRQRIGNGGMQALLQSQRPAAAPPAAPVPAQISARPSPAPAEPAKVPEAAPATAAAKAAPPTSQAAAPHDGAPAQPGPKEGRGKAPAAAADGAQPGAVQAEEAGAEEKAPLEGLKAQVGQIARRQRKPADKAALVGRTRRAAIAPGPEGTSRAAAATLEDLKQAGETGPPFDTAAFKEALRKKLLSAMPDGKTGDDVRKALSSETTAEVASEMKGELGRTQAKTVGNLPDAVQKQQDPGKHSPEDPPPALTPTPPGQRPAAPSAAGAVPPKVPDAALDTQADRNDADAQLASQDLNQDQLKRSNEPSFVDAAQTRDAAERHSETGPPEVRKAEQEARGEAWARGAGALAAGIGGLFGSRAAGFLSVFGQQDAAKVKEQAERARIAGELDNIQRKTRDDVKVVLDEMETEALKRFERGLEAALVAFDRQRKRTEEIIRKVNRDDALSSGDIFGAAWAGWARLSKDDVNYAISRARRAYNEAVDRAIDDVANYVGPVLARVKQRIEQGRADAAAYVKLQGGEVAVIAAGELERINTEFDTLAIDVDSRRDGLINKLGESYAASRKKVEERVEAFRNANKSWWQKLKEKIRGVIRAIIQIKDMFVSMLKKLAGVVRAILSDPPGFLGNMVSAVKRGLNNFTSKFLDHLKAGFLEWLFGEAAKGGIVMPKKFDAPGVFGLIAGLLGLTVENVRQRAVAKVGATAVGALEKGAGLLMTLKEKGVAGLWDMLSEKLEAQKEAALEQVQSMLLIEVVKAGIAWLIGLLNPVAGFIKACKAIYEIVMFFVNNGKRIMDFVDAVIDSIGAVAKGQLDEAAAKVEYALARMIPLIIGFLAALLSLGSITDKVKKVIARLQAPVNKAIDWAIDKAVAGVKGAGRAVATAAKGLFNWARAKVGFKDSSGESHTIYVDVDGGAPKLMIASAPLGARAFLTAYVKRKSAASATFKKTRKVDIKAANDAIELAEDQVKVIARARKATGKGAKSDLSDELEKLLQLNVGVSSALKKLIGSDESVGAQEEEKYLLEGVTGTYSSIPKPKGDALTADHQPQAAILQAAAKMKFFKKTGEMVERAEARATKGFAINLHHRRHIAGRTFGSKGKKTKEEFVALVKDEVKDLPSEKAQRKAAVRIIRIHLKADSKMMVEDVCAPGSAHFGDIEDLGIDDTKKKKMVREIKARIKAGQEQMTHQDLDSLVD